MYEYIVRSTINYLFKLIVCWDTIRNCSLSTVFSTNKYFFLFKVPVQYLWSFTFRAQFFRKFVGVWPARRYELIVRPLRSRCNKNAYNMFETNVNADWVTIEENNEYGVRIKHNMQTRFEFRVPKTVYVHNKNE